MKKILAFISALAVMTALTGCGSVVEEGKSDSQSVAETTAAQTEASSEATADTEENTTASTENSGTSDDSETNSPTETGSGNTASNTANDYGFYPVETPIYTSISVASLAGVWYLADDMAKNTLIITSSEDDIYNGTWQYAYEYGGSRFGYIKIEYTVNQDGYNEYWYNFYETDGELWESFAADGSIPNNDLFAAQSGDPHFARAASGSEGGMLDKGGEYLGVWGCGRATMHIEEGGFAGGRYVITISWASSAFENTVWTYDCYFDESVNAYVSDYGTRCEEVYTEEGVEPERTTTDGEKARFYAENGAIRWENLVGDTEEDMLFTK